MKGPDASSAPGGRPEARRRGLNVVADPAIDVQPVVGPTDVPEGAARAGGPRLVRHLVTLDDGFEVGVAVCGHGVPLVLVHGFTAEGILYAQTLSRLVDMGFKVVAIDVAGHGATLGLPTGGATMDAYTRLLARVVDTLGIRRAVFVGHSMGGRLVAELAASEPDRVIAVVLLDAIVGATWDRMVYLFRVAPPLFLGVAGVLVIDTLSTIPLFRDPRQAGKLARLVAPTLLGHVRRPWRMWGPAVSIMRSRGSGPMLDRIAEEHLPLIVIHGDRDFAVPLPTARSAARRGHGELVVVEKATHSWLLKDPEALPAIFAELDHGILGRARRDALAAAGVKADPLHPEHEEAAFLEPDSLVAEMTLDEDPRTVRVLHRHPRYRWRMTG